ncbi:peptide deformylase [Arthrobacter sp. M4]|uniref:peptide deformylase n=1 Tax=Arthrobacter sp. M4 TaxID=218160 RepID=UPI001CDB5084|nr:peptide deformylase [Arthrobacter sp. M4]MCA4131449.1 peptide deformylase [Arthrobacter sp. M4]
MTFPLSPPTPYSAAQIRDTVQMLLASPVLPPVVQAGHPVLRQHAAPYDGQLGDGELKQLIQRMREVMHNAPGVGLAAPQLGIPLQVAVLEDKFDTDPDVAELRDRRPLDFFAILNPRYTGLGAAVASFYEGCLSVHGLQAVVSRYRDVRLDYETADGSSASAEYRGWQARIVQHETDHLHGILYLDKAELRSIACNEEYSARWAEPGIVQAQEALGFLSDDRTGLRAGPE